jgi:hypothetical protein
MAGTKLIINHYYKINDRGGIYKAQYIGSDNDFECCVCGKGHKARCFNIWYNHENGVEDYETWGFGKEHMPEIIEEIDEADKIN